MLFDVKNPQGSDVGFGVVEAQEVRCQMLHRLIHLPRCQLVSLDVRKVFLAKVQWKFRNMSCTFTDLICIAQFGDLEEST